MKYLTIVILVIMIGCVPARRLPTTDGQRISDAIREADWNRYMDQKAAADAIMWQKLAE